MTTAIIVISVLLAVGLVLFFTAVGIKRSNPNKYKRVACYTKYTKAAAELASADVLAETAETLAANSESASNVESVSNSGITGSSDVLAVANPSNGWTKFKAWWANHRPSKRRLIQLYCAVLYNANIKGFISGEIYTSATTKYMCVPGLNCYSCPGAVGACPMGALQNGLAESNTRAPYYILGILAIFGLMFARTVCGFLCPIGFGQELLYKARTPKLKKNRVTRILSYLKYVILALAIALPLIYAMFDIPLPAFCKYICPAGTVGGAVMLLINPNNASMFGQLGWQFTWKFCLAIAFIVSSVFIYRVFCRFICPLGAIYGFFNRFALIGVSVDKKSCTDCGLCVAHCKMDVKRVGDHECINCGECMSVCPTKAISWKGSKIFLHADATAELAPTVKPLSVENGIVKIEQGDGAVREIPQSEYIADSVAKAEIAAYDTQDAVKRFAPSSPAVSKKKPKKSVKFWLEMTVWILALALLVGALVYYNFVDVKAPGPVNTETGYEVGDVAPDFTVNLYGSEGGEFNLYANRGKVTVINFWATWCTPCVNEMPYFNQLAQNYDIEVIAIHGMITRDVQKFIDDNWSDYIVTFAQDVIENNQSVTYRMLGGNTAWPMTVIVDEEGTVVYNDIRSFHSYDDMIRVLGEYLQ